MTAQILTEAPSIESLRPIARDGEVFVEIRHFDAWMRCQHGKQIVLVKAHWSDDCGRVVTTGMKNSSQWYERTVHADGTGPRVDQYGGCPFEYNTVSKCPKCGELNTLVTKQLAYGDETTCSHDGCDYRSYYSIGD